MIRDSKLVVLALLCILFLLQIPVVAVVLPPEKDEIQNLEIVTSVDVIGSMSYEEDISCASSNEILGQNLVLVDNQTWESRPEPPLNSDGEVQSHVTYSEDTQANMGAISYRKTSEVDTEALAGAQYNVWNERLITFSGIDAGTLLSSEDMAMYNVGTCIIPTLSICPFCACCDCPVNPAFCSRVETGSDLDMSKVTAYLAGGFRNVNEMGDSTVWPPVPSIDGAALAKYTVQVTEMGQGEPSLGSVSTYLKVHESDSASPCPNPGVDPSRDMMQNLEISELRSIKGAINLFEYQMNFESKMMGNGC